MANLSKIKILLREKNITIRDFSGAIGLTEQGLQKLIRENNTRVDTLEQIARTLNVPIQEFFDPELCRQSAPVETIVSNDELKKIITTQLEVIKSQQETIKAFTAQLQKRTA